MKFLGKIIDPKDVTTKEYVDNADEAILTKVSEADVALEKKKVNYEDIQSFTDEEIQELWNKHIK